MRKNLPNKPNMEAIFDLLTSLDGDLLKAIPEQGISITITITPVVPDEDDDPEDDDSDEMEDEDDEDCCPDYEPADDGDGRCVYCCPECGACLRQYIEEAFE